MRLYQKLGKRLPQICVKCGRTDDLVVHHRNKNKPNDLEILGRSCHTIYHHIGKKNIKKGRPKMNTKEELMAKDRFRALQKYHNLLPKKEKCQKCGSKERLEYHHKDYNINSKVEIWCKSCHLSYHKNSLENIPINPENRKYNTKRTKSEYWCIWCGKSYLVYMKGSHKGYFCSRKCNLIVQKKIKRGQIIFPIDNEKLAEYLKSHNPTEVFKIEINKITEFYKDTFFIRGKDVDKEDLAKRDGFRDEAINAFVESEPPPPTFISAAEQMFKYLDKAYDLSQAKEFFVYRWCWK